MDTETLCQKILQQAAKGGFNTWDWYKQTGTTSLFEYGIRKGYLLSVLFNHTFAKALFGEEWRDVPGMEGVRGNFPWWQLQLTQLVLFQTDEEKLQYIGNILQLGDTHPSQPNS